MMTKKMIPLLVNRAAAKKLIYLFVLATIIFSLPSFFTELIPRPYDWLIKLVVHSVSRLTILMIPVFLLTKIFEISSKPLWPFSAGTLLLIPQSIADCGLIHYKFSGFGVVKEFSLDWPITICIFICYAWSTILIIKDLRKL